LKSEAAVPGAKAFSYFQPLSARLKSCPDTSCLLNEFFRGLQRPSSSSVG
jgi:hypothetical protein